MIETEIPGSQLLVFEDPATLFEVADAYVRRLAIISVQARGRFLLTLSGGSTPLPLYRRLAKVDEKEPFPWQQTHIFWGDERMVPISDPESNAGQAESLLLSHVPVPDEQIYPIPHEEDPVASAEAYAHTLEQAAEADTAWPRFDLVLLGLGSDGHTASLFPGSTFPVPAEQPTQAVLAKYGGRPVGRVSLTPPVFNSARYILFLVTGEEKAQALAQILEGDYDPVQWPAQRIQPEDGKIVWLADAAAASQVVQR